VASLSQAEGGRRSQCLFFFLYLECPNKKFMIRKRLSVIILMWARMLVFRLKFWGKWIRNTKNNHKTYYGLTWGLDKFVFAYYFIWIVKKTASTFSLIDETLSHVHIGWYHPPSCLIQRSFNIFSQWALYHAATGVLRRLTTGYFHTCLNCWFSESYSFRHHSVWLQRPSPRGTNSLIAPQS